MSDRALELRQAFDQSFARAPREPAAVRKYLVVGAVGSSWAIPLAHIEGVVPIRSITPLPKSSRALLGLAGHRGAAVAVFDLPTLLGHPRAESARWMALAGPEVGLAFSSIDGWVESAQAIETLQMDGKTCVIIDVRSILHDLEKRIPTIGK